ADRGAAFYDKLVGFVDDLKAVGGAVTKAQEKYDDALAKLCDGRGNVIRQAEMLKDLGVRPAKDLPSDLLERSSAEPIPIEVVPIVLPPET
ncbi:MAG: DNA recombination protein RmuC, partial [Candidatus Acidiferrales bacterium]